MSGAAQIDIQGFSGEAVDGDALARVQPLWEAMFDHHAHIGGAGLPMITRADTWRHRVNHYSRVFAGERNPALWLAFQHGKPVGYAVAYEYAECGERGMLLESLSVLPETRGLGVGGRLMDAVDAHARAAGVRHAAVEVLGGNARARALYVRRGYAPHTESWMRTAPPPRDVVHAVLDAYPSPEAAALAAVTRRARALGGTFRTSPGPDDIWVTAMTIAELVSDPATPATMVAGSAVHRDAVRELVAELDAVGLWTLRYEIPAGPAAEPVRDLLRWEGFALSTERLTLAPERVDRVR